VLGKLEGFRRSRASGGSGASIPQAFHRFFPELVAETEIGVSGLSVARGDRAVD
jgi:hypothetical protein